ncbi:MAG: hypothetical protein IJA52_00360 [Clostridia bacterium]|nr:hypothetical protein [Clostridia bacterium]
MKKTKFQIIQQWLSLIPFWSTLFIAIVTYIDLFRKKVSAVYWIKYGLNFFISAIAITLLNGVIMTGEHLILNIIASAALLVLTNFYFVQLQFEAMQKNQAKESNNDITSANSKGFTKKHIIILVAIPLSLWAIGVTVFACYRIVDIFMEDMDKKIEDTNGPDDFSVVTITDEEIAKTDYSNYSSFLFGSSTDGAPSGVSDKGFRDVDYDKTRYTSNSLSGIYVANVTKTDSDTMSLKITSTVESGNAEIYVFVDDKLHSEVNINETVELSVEGISGKTVYVKVACESANMSIQVERDY